MEIISIILIVISLSFFIYNIYDYNKKKKKIKEEKEKILLKSDQEIKEALEKKQQEFNNQICELQAKFKQEKINTEIEHNNYINNLEKIKALEIDKYQVELDSLKHLLDVLNQDYTDKKKEYEKYLETAVDIVNKQVQEIKTSKIETMNAELAVISAANKKAADQEFAQYTASYEEKKLLLTTEIDTIQAKLTEFQEQQNAINREIMRRREIEEKQDFYRICIDKEAEEDMKIIQTFLPQLHFREKINKLIYDNYISKPTLEMAKRVLSGRDPSGIYKITNIQTGEIYIGQSTGVKTRWTNHVKSACGLEGVADSMFQRALKKYGVDNFTFELLEEVEKENLRTREKFYIMNYETDKYGYNQKIG